MHDGQPSETGVPIDDREQSLAEQPEKGTEQQDSHASENIHVADASQGKDIGNEHMEEHEGNNSVAALDDHRGEKRTQDVAFDLNDAEQLRFIAEQLESVSRGGIGMSHDDKDDDSNSAVGHDANSTANDNDHSLTGMLSMGNNDHDGHGLGLSVLNDYTEEQYELEDMFNNDPTTQVRIKSLPILDNLSTQILSMFGRGSYTDTFNIVTQPESELGQAYRTLLSLLEQTKKLYSMEAFLSASQLGFSKSPRYRAIVRKANLTTFVASVFGSTEVGFFHLNEYFLDSFVPEGARLLKSQGVLYLDLKTQAYISAMGQSERYKEEILDDLFPDDLDQQLLSRRGSRTLTPSEYDFVSRCKSRKEFLMASDDSLEALSEKYQWQNFLKDVSEYISKNCQSLAAAPSAIASKRMRRLSPAAAPPSLLSDHVVQASPIQSGSNNNSRRVRLDDGAPLDTSVTDGDASMDTTSSNMASGFDGTHSSVSAGSPNTNVGLIASSSRKKTQPRSRIPSTTSQRRPWTKEEETALMHGLDEVKGPRWSQILELYGPGGRISEVLKDRNQVQLKDKARNLKLFFLKSGLQVPYYLRFVTGELKSRGGSKKRELGNEPVDGREIEQDQTQHTPMEDIDQTNAIDKNNKDDHIAEVSSNGGEQSPTVEPRDNEPKAPMDIQESTATESSEHSKDSASESVGPLNNNVEQPREANPADGNASTAESFEETTVEVEGTSDQ
ncbi:telomere repeat binding factor-domain-containing protein [Dipodascopsis uninucleata]